MSIVETTLLAREEIAEGTMAFHVAKPPGFGFKPGQAVDLILSDAPTTDADSVRHAFSLVSAPFQDDLIVATRMRDSKFKRSLKALAIGASVKLDGPFGSLTLHSNRARAAVFIAGGIGITPFMSILRQATHDKLPQQILLLYSNRRPEDSAFLVELRQLAEQNRNFRLIATMTAMAKSSVHWDGETGLVDWQMVKRIGVDLPTPIYYVAGPPGMVSAMRETLGRVGIDDDDIRSEEFYGY